MLFIVQLNQKSGTVFQIVKLKVQRKSNITIGLEQCHKSTMPVNIT